MTLREKINQAHPFLKAMIWIGYIILGFLLLMLPYAAYMAITKDQSVATLRIVMVLQSLLVFALPCVLAALAWTSRPFTWLHMNVGFRWQTALLIVLMMILALPGINLLADLNSRVVLPESLSALEQLLREMEETAQAATLQLMSGSGVGQVIISLFVLAVMPALSEEMCFRGTMMGLMGGSKNKHMIIWVTAIVFSLIHFQFYGFVPRMLLGALLGYLLAWTGSLWAPVLAHMVNNASVVVFTYLANAGTINADSIETFGTGGQWWLGAISLIITVVLLYVISRDAKRLPDSCEATHELN